MGGDQSTKDPPQTTITQFRQIKAIGYGGFGRVWWVLSKHDSQDYALKIIAKAKVLAKKSVRSVMNEKAILSRLYHPFIINMHKSFQDRQNLYIVMDFLAGGDLRHHINIKAKFSQEILQFIMACIILAIEYLHFHNIIHRDIKPQNLVFTKDGYLKLTDFGIANYWQPKNCMQNSGTPGYMAPEVIGNLNHSFAADYFALGVIGYEISMGERPYRGSNRKQIKDAIIAKQVQIGTKTQTIFPISNECKDLINRLIQRKPAKRLGSGGVFQIRSHPFFKRFDWMRLDALQTVSPFNPRPKLDLMIRQGYLNEGRKSQLQLESEMLLRNKQVQKLFKGYEFNPQKERKQDKPFFSLSIQNDPSYFEC